MTERLASIPVPQSPSPRVRHLLATARADFMAQGFAAVSIDGLARAAGVSKETIYRHFVDKEALFRAALQATDADFSRQAEALHHQSLTPGEELSGLALAILDSAVDGGLLNPLRVSAGVAPIMPDFAQALQRAYWQGLEPVRRALEAYARAQGITAEVPLELALDFGSLAVGGPALLLGYPPPGPSARARMAAQVAGLFEDGVLRSAILRKAGDGLAPGPTATTGVSASVAPHIRTLLDIAANHFLTEGYDGASLATIGAEARVGRGTIYRHFASKQGLFAAVLRDMAQQCARVEVPALPEDADAAALGAFVAAAIRALASPAALALQRAAIAASTSSPALAREIDETVRGPWLEAVASWLPRVTAATEPRWLASQLLVLALQGNRLIATGYSPDEAEAASRGERTATIFLHGFTAIL